MKRLEEVYPHLFFARSGEDLRVLDESLAPRPPTVMEEMLAGLSPHPGWLVLDVGCGRGERGSALAERFRFQVIGLDAVASNLPLSRSVGVDRGVGALMSFVCGDMMWLPLRHRSLDLVWCRDMIEHVSDPSRALAECWRVLKPGGRMLLQTSVETSRMSETDRQMTYGPQAIARAPMSRDLLDQAIAGAAFELLNAEELGGEIGEWREERESRASVQLLRVARMVRAEDRFRHQLGERYDTLLALYLWDIFHLIGKLSTVVYLLRKAPSRPAR